MDLFNFSLSQLHLPGPVALAAVAVFGYMVGRWHRQTTV